MNTCNWLNTAVADYDWIVCGENYTDPSYPAFKAERAASLNTNILFFAVQSGGYAIHPSSKRAVLPGLNYDLLGRLAEEIHRRDMKLIVYWLATEPSCRIQMEKHPDWKQLDYHQKPTGCLCYMSPFGEYLLDWVEEVVSGYDIDGINFDQLTAGCYCPHCRERFQKRFGADMLQPAFVGNLYPGGSLQGIHLEAEEYGQSLISPDKQLKTFTDENTEWWMSRLDAIIQKYKPGLAFLHNKIWGQNLKNNRHRLHAVLPEVLWWTVGYDLDRVALHRQICRLVSNNLPCFDLAKYDHTNRQRRNLAEIKLLFANGLTVDANPMLRECRAADLNPEAMKDLSEYLGHIKQHIKKNINSQRLVDVALIYSSAVDAKSEHDMGDSLSGAYQLLRENQRIVDLVSDENIDLNHLQNYKVVILPEYANVPPHAESILCDYYKQGGSVFVSLGEIKNEAVDFEKRPLGKILGIKNASWAGLDCRPGKTDYMTVVKSNVFHPYNYAQIVSDERISPHRDAVITFETPFLHANYSPSCRPFLHVLETELPNHSERYDRPSLRPGQKTCPLGVSCQEQGKLVFWGAPVFRREFRSWNYETDELVCGAIKWLIGENQEIGVENAPQSLRINAHLNEQEQSYTIVLTNQSTNDKREGKIRYVQASNEFKIILHPRFPVSKIQMVLGTPVKMMKTDLAFIVTIPSIQYLEILKIY